MSPPILPERPTNFTAIPRRLLDAALCSDMSKRELFLWLLVARLTYGAQGKSWVALRPADLRVIGIGSNHARAVLDGMLARNLLMKNGDRAEYRIAAPDAVDVIGLPWERQQRLRQMVVRQIGTAWVTTRPISDNGEKGSQNGEFEAAFVPEKGSEPFPKGEEMGSQKRNASTVPLWAFSRSQRRFVKKNDMPIDKVKTMINNQPHQLTDHKEAR